LKLTTDRHEASRGFFATAELLVFLGVAQEKNGSVLAEDLDNKSEYKATDMRFGAPFSNIGCVIFIMLTL